jgi:hypothetical protein
MLVGSGCGGPASPVQQEVATQPGPKLTPTAVATYHNDNSRTGANTTESILTPDNVNAITFGKVATVKVQGAIYGQPLYVPNVTVDGQSRNLVVVATEHDQVYAIDSDTHAIVWNADFLASDGSVTPLSPSDVNGCTSIAPEIGITSTPVIDTSTETLYLVARTKETQNGQVEFYQRLHALDVTTGKDKQPPTAITTPSNGVFGAAQFDSVLNNQRSALLLANGQIFVTWASHCDFGVYQGWVMAFSASTLQFTSAWTPAPSGNLGGIWMAGGGPAADPNGDVYLAVGNGSTDAQIGGENYGDSVVRLHGSAGALSVSDSFTPFDFQHMFDDDLDLGSGGPALLPTQTGMSHPNLLVVAGKDGTLYLLDRDNLGKWQTNDTQIVQTFKGDAQASFGTPAVWNNEIVFGFMAGPLEAFLYHPDSQLIDSKPISTSGTIAINYPGATPSISANGANNGIVWVIQNFGPYSILRAFKALDLSIELYDSRMSPNRDNAGLSVTFGVPTIADGKVFVGTGGELDIYGLLSN